MAKWVNVVGPDGKARAVPDWSIGKLPAGYRVESPEERRERVAREQVEGPMGQLGAAAASAARGVTLGVSDVAMTHTGAVSPDTLNALKQEFPVTSTVGEIGGAIGGALLQKKAPNPAGLTAKLGTAIERKVALNIAGKYGTGLAGRMAEQFIPKAAGALAEGGVYGVGHLISEDALGNAELTADNLISYAGTGALLSGAAGGAFAAGGELARSSVLGARNLAGDAVEKIWNRATGAEPAKGLGKAWAKMSAVASGAKEEDIADLLVAPLSKAGAERRAAAVAGKNVREQAAGELAEIANHVKRASSRIQEEAMGELKMNQIRNLVKTGNEEDVARGVFGVLADLNNLVSAHLDDVDQFGSLGKTYGKKAKQFLNQAGREIRDLYEVQKPRRGGGTAAARPSARGDVTSVVGKQADANAMAYNAVDRLKRKIGAFKKLRTRPNAQELATVDAYKKMYEDLRVLLEDESLWGQMGKAQREINGAWANYLRNADLFRQRFMTQVDQASEFNEWVRRYDVDPAKIERFLKDVADPRGDIPKQILQNNIVTERALAEKISKFYDLGKAGKDVQDMAANSARLESLLKDVEGKVILGNQLAALDEAQRMMPGMSGAIVGYGVGGIAGGAAAAGAVGLASQPGRLVRTLFALESLSSKSLKTMNSAVDGFIDRSMKKRSNWRPKVAPIVSGLQARRDKFDEKRRDVEAKLQNPIKTGELMQRNMESMTEAAPNVHAAMMKRGMAGLAYLQQKMPKGLRTNIAALGEDRYPRDSEIIKWLRVARAVENPMSLVEDLAEGRVDRAAVEAVKAVYPAYYQQIRETLIARVGELQERLPYKSRVQLSIAFDATLEPTLRPEIKQHMRMANAQLMQQMQGGPEGGQRPSGGGRKSAATSVDERRTPTSARLEQA